MIEYYLEYTFPNIAKLIVNMLINGVRYRVLIDTGADISVCRSNMLLNMFNKRSEQVDKIVLTGFGGSGSNALVYRLDNFIMTALNGASIVFDNFYYAVQIKEKPAYDLILSALVFKWMELCFIPSPRHIIMKSVNNHFRMTYDNRFGATDVLVCDLING